MDLIALAKNVLHTQDQICKEQTALKTHALPENTSHWPELAYHAKHAKLLSQGRPHATIQTVVLEISSPMLVLAILAQFSRNQAHSMLNVEPLVLSVHHQPDNAWKKMEIACNAQVTLDAKEINLETMMADKIANSNAVQIYAKWEKNWCKMVLAYNAQTTPEVQVFSNKVNILNACLAIQRTTKWFERTEPVDHVIHSRKQTQTTEDATCLHAKLQEHTFWNKMLSSTSAQTGPELM